MIRYAHDMRDRHYPDIKVTDAVSDLFGEMKIEIQQGNNTATVYLDTLRALDKQ